MKNRPWEIYCLVDPRMLHARYVGITNNGTRRYDEHIRRAARGEQSHRANWIRQLLALNLRPIYLVLEYGTGNDWATREIFWIKSFRKHSDLCNHTDGGDGTRGWVPTLAQRAAMSAALRGRYVSPETREKMRAANMGKRHTDATKTKMSTASKGRHQSPEHIKNNAVARRGLHPTKETREKLAAAKRGTHHSDETRKKMSEAQLGKMKSPAHCNALSDALKGVKKSPAHCANNAAAQKRYWARKRDIPPTTETPNDKST